MIKSINNQERFTRIIIWFLCVAFLTIFSKKIFTFYSNIALWITIFVVLAWMLHKNTLNRQLCIFFVISMFYLFFSVMLVGGGIGSVFVLLSSMLLMWTLQDIHLITMHKKIIKTVVLIAIIFLFLNSFVFRDDFVGVSDSQTKINTNTYGMFLLFSFCIWCSYAQFKFKKQKIKFLIVLVAVVFAMLNYRSRGTLIALLSFVLLTIVPRKFITAKRVKRLFWMVLIVGTLFPIIYVWLYTNGYENLKILGKTIFSGRQSIWLNMFESFTENPFCLIVGLGSHAILWEGNDLNVHNNFWNIIVNFGLIGFFIYYGFIYFMFNNAVKNVKNTTVKKLLFMFVCSVMILGLTETTTLWSAIFILSSWGLGAACSESKFKCKMEVEKSIDYGKKNTLLLVR